MTKLAKTRVRTRKGDQSWSLVISEDRQARRVMICTVSTLRPTYLHAAHVCRLPSRSARQCAGMQDTALKPCRSRPCALACPQTWSMTSSDRPCEPGHAFSPTLSSTFWLRLVPDRAPRQRVRYAGRSVETVQIMTLRACLSSDMAKDQL